MGLGGSRVVGGGVAAGVFSNRQMRSPRPTHNKYKQHVIKPHDIPGSAHLRSAIDWCFMPGQKVKVVARFTVAAVEVMRAIVVRWGEGVVVTPALRFVTSHNDTTGVEERARIAHSHEQAVVNVQLTASDQPIIFRKTRPF